MQDVVPGESPKGFRGQAVRRVASLATFASIVAVIACSGDEPSGPSPVRLRPDASATINPSACMYRRSDWRRSWWGKWDPDTMTICGVVVSVAAPPAFGDTGVAWYWGIDPDTVYISSGSVSGAYDGQHQTYVYADKPIRDVQIIWDFTPQPGSRITLYNAQDSVLDSHDVGSAPEPSRWTFNFPSPGLHSRETHTFPARGVRKIRFEALGKHPEAGASIMAMLFFIPDTTCPPSGEPMLDSGAVKDSMIASLTRSNPNAAPGSGQRRERGGIIWELPNNGGYLAAEEMRPQYATATECGYGLNAAGLTAPVAGALARAYWHTHPHSTNADVYGCQSSPGQPQLAQTPGDGKIVPRATPDLNGGGSDGDWNAATNTGYPVFAINKDGRIYKMMPNTAVHQRSSNPNKWEWKNPQPAGCLPRIP